MNTRRVRSKARKDNNGKPQHVGEQKIKASLDRQLAEDIRAGKVKVEGDHAAVGALVIMRNIPIPYSYIATLMRTPSAFGDGPACIICHSSNDPAEAYRGLDRFVWDFCFRVHGLAQGVHDLGHFVELLLSPFVRLPLVHKSPLGLLLSYRCHIGNSLLQPPYRFVLRKGSILPRASR